MSVYFATIFNLLKKEIRQCLPKLFGEYTYIYRCQCEVYSHQRYCVCDNPSLSVLTFFLTNPYHSNTSGSLRFTFTLLSPQTKRLISTTWSSCSVVLFYLFVSFIFPLSQLLSTSKFLFSASTQPFALLP